MILEILPYIRKSGTGFCLVCAWWFFFVVFFVWLVLGFCVACSVFCLVWVFSCRFYGIFLVVAVVVVAVVVVVGSVVVVVIVVVVVASLQRRLHLLHR